VSIVGNYDLCLERWSHDKQGNEHSKHMDIPLHRYHRYINVVYSKIDRLGDIKQRTSYQEQLWQYKINTITYGPVMVLGYLQNELAFHKPSSPKSILRQSYKFPKSSMHPNITFAFPNFCTVIIQTQLEFIYTFWQSDSTETKTMDHNHSNLNHIHPILIAKP